MKTGMAKYWNIGLSVLIGIVIFLFWYVAYPHALTYQEQLQLFLFDADYFCERMAEPGGLARYIAEFLVQFYNATLYGALILAVLFMVVQRLTWRLMRSEDYHVLSLIPTLVLWFAMGDENVMLAYVVALIMAMGCILGLRLLERLNLIGKVIIALVALPLLYWLIGPLVLLVAVCMVPTWLAGVAVIYVVALVLASAWLLPYPLMRLAVGIGYYRFPVTVPYLLLLIPALIAMMYYGCRHLPKPKQGVRYALVFGIIALLFVPQHYGFDAKKYELMEYDYLVRTKDWNGIISKAEQQTPDKPMSVRTCLRVLSAWL